MSSDILGLSGRDRLRVTPDGTDDGGGMQGDVDAENTAGAGDERMGNWHGEACFTMKESSGMPTATAARATVRSSGPRVVGVSSTCTDFDGFGRASHLISYTSLSPL